MYKRGRWGLIGFKADLFLRDAIERGAEKSRCANISQYIREAVQERLTIDGIKVGSDNSLPDPTPLLVPLDGVALDEWFDPQIEELANRPAVAESVPVNRPSANGAQKTRTLRGPTKTRSAARHKTKRASRKKGDAS